MTTGGWIMMIAAWTGIIGLTVWCLWRVLGGGRHKVFGGPQPPIPPTA